MPKRADDLAKVVPVGVSLNSHERLLLQECERYRVPPEYVWRIIKKESEFNVNAVSSTGARGLGQLTGRALVQLEAELNRKFDPFNPDDAIRAVVHIIAGLMRRHPNADFLDIYTMYNIGETGWKDAVAEPASERTRARVSAQVGVRTTYPGYRSMMAKAFLKQKVPATIAQG